MADRDVLAALREVIDPELGINITDLGLVYRAARTADAIEVAMTTTSPSCPLGEFLTEQATTALRERFPEIQAVTVELVRDPPWHPDMITAEGRRQLGWAEPEPVTAPDVIGVWRPAD